MYLTNGDTPTECIQAAIDWHNAKPNNPETGVPNPTIFIAEYQYLQDRKYGIPIDYVSQINKADGTVVTRPGARLRNRLFRICKREYYSVESICTRHHRFRVVCSYAKPV